ncbi:hypothetical protein TNCT_258311 [Trichonephila clavata]|uniref:Secreted protein n=1 Tax=Trichonephila clavata TaxID=2740835 RepID=A0A8X6LZJ9_TRICU|nr:hypothetical protein TNCT_258311 [Trichonephila clavata]
MFTYMHGLIHKWFYLGCLLIQGTGSLTLPIEHPKFWTWFSGQLALRAHQDESSCIACRGLSPKELPRCGLWWEGPQWLSVEWTLGLSNPKEMTD